eukprot:tig00020614_g12137.t1
MSGQPVAAGVAASTSCLLIARKPVFAGRHTPLPYNYEIKGAEEAAKRTGMPTRQTLKTLVVDIELKSKEKQQIFVLMPGDGAVDMKKLAAVMRAKGARMTNVDRSHEVTGYMVGGTSPFGSKTALPVVLEASVMTDEFVEPLEGDVVINGGARGMLVRLARSDLVALLGPTVADLQAAPKP